jgi:beta-fructofuranosidase
VLHLEDKWIWDFWFTQDEGITHIFYLQAPRSLGNPDLRHKNSTIGHAVSTDLVNWDIMPDALYPSEDENAWDSLATWTGSIIREGQIWYMFYTGISKKDKGLIQRIGLATSDDLLHWTKHPANPLLPIAPQWYELLDEDIWYEQAWRDPWLFKYGDKFHAFITARVNSGSANNRGVIGHAISHDLVNWEAQAPIPSPRDYAQLEVPQLQQIKQKWYLLYSRENKKASEDQQTSDQNAIELGIYYMMAENPFGPFTEPDENQLSLGSGTTHYAGKMIKDNRGNWYLFTTLLNNSSGDFVGDISDPIPLSVDRTGRLHIIKK